MALPQFNITSSGLIALWRLEEISNSASYIDSSLNGNQNDLSRNANIDRVVGANQTHNTGSGAFFGDSTTSYLFRTDANSADFEPGASSFSLGGWFRTPTDGTGENNKSLLSKFADSPNFGYALFIGSDNPAGIRGHTRFVWSTDGTSQFFVEVTDTTFSFPANEWVHVITSYDRTAGEARLYINGSGLATETNNIGDIHNTTAEFRLGLRDVGINGDFPHNGDMDEAFFFLGRAINDNEASGIFQNGFAGAPQQSGIIGVYAQGIAEPRQSGIIGVYSEGREPPIQSGIIGVYSEGKEPPLQSGIIGVYAQGTSPAEAELASGIIGVYAQGTATETVEDIEQEFDGRFFVEVDAAEDFDAETRVTNSNTRDFDAQIKIFRTSPAADVCIFDPSLSGVALSINSNFDFQASGTTQGDRRMIYGRWTFGDFTANSGISELSVLAGKISGVFTTSHTYTTSGIFYTTVEIMDDIGVRSDDDVRIIVTNGQTPTNFLNLIPQVSLSGTPTSGNVPLSVVYTHNITNLGGRSPVTKLLDFGDGTANVGSLQPDITHVYSQIGRYVPILTILFDDGLIVSDSLLVNPNT